MTEIRTPTTEEIEAAARETAVARANAYARLCITDENGRDILGRDRYAVKQRATEVITDLLLSHNRRLRDVIIADREQRAQPVAGDELRAAVEPYVRAIDEALVTRHLGVFNHGDDIGAALLKISEWDDSVGAYFEREKAALASREARPAAQDVRDRIARIVDPIVEHLGEQDKVFRAQIYAKADAILAALPPAQASAEPVEWKYDYGSGIPKFRLAASEILSGEGWTETPLYAQPPATDAESARADEREAWRSMDSAPKTGEPIILFARHIEASASAPVIGWWHYDMGWIALQFGGAPTSRLVPSCWMPRPSFPVARAATPVDAADGEG